MNYHAMMKEYKHIDISSKIENADGHEFIKIIFEELISNLKALSYAIQNDPKNLKKSKYFSQSLSSIMILSQSLDFEKGEPIASNLFNLYDYCRRSIIKDYRKNEYEDINVCISVLDDIYGAWSQIG
jgi:flagellar protein FliS